MSDEAFVRRDQLDALGNLLGAAQRTAHHHRHVMLTTQVLQRFHQRFGLDDAGIGRPECGDRMNIRFAGLDECRVHL